MKWYLTTPENTKRVNAVLLADGAWHAVMYASFEVDNYEEANLASWIEKEEFRCAAPATEVKSVRIIRIERKN